jgi:glc operon protein GlcG
MRHSFWIGAATSAALLLATTVYAQQPTQPAASPPAPVGYGAAITLEQAKSVAAAAEAEMKKNSFNMVITVAGPNGETIYLQKADVAGNASIVIAQDKAKHAALFKTASKAYQDRLANGETYILRLTGATPVAGGVPLVSGGKIVGAIGISGGSAAQDHQVAQAGADSLK